MNIVKHFAIIGAAASLGCSSSSGPDQPPPPPPTGVQPSVVVRGSGGVGNILALRIGTFLVGAPVDAAVRALPPGTYEVTIEHAPEWCDVEDPASSITVEEGRVTPLLIQADCVGGLAYTLTREFGVRFLTTDGFERTASTVVPSPWLQSWAPDGSQLGFRDGLFMRLYDPTSDQTTVFANDGTREDELTWSPDGQSVAWSRGGERGPGGDTEIIIADRDGSDLRPLFTDGGGPDLAPAWSPDGASMHFISHRGSLGRSLHRVDLDGTGLSS